MDIEDKNRGKDMCILNILFLQRYKKIYYIRIKKHSANNFVDNFLEE